MGEWEFQHISPLYLFPSSGLISSKSKAEYSPLLASYFVILTQLSILSLAFPSYLFTRLPPDQRRGYKNVFNALIRIAQEEGVPTLWRVSEGGRDLGI